jgi:hypothetical protein
MPSILGGIFIFTQHILLSIHFLCALIYFCKNIKQRNGVEQKIESSHYISVGIGSKIVLLRNV